MKINKFNKDQRKFVSDFLNSLSVAWFSAGAIAPFFIEIDDKIKLDDDFYYGDGARDVCFFN